LFAFAFVHLLPAIPRAWWRARGIAGPGRAVRVELWLDRPIWEQYLPISTRWFHFELGRSIKTHEPVSALIGERFIAKRCG